MLGRCLADNSLSSKRGRGDLTLRYHHKGWLSHPSLKAGASSPQYRDAFDIMYRFVSLDLETSFEVKRDPWSKLRHFPAHEVMDQFPYRAHFVAEGEFAFSPEEEAALDVAVYCGGKLLVDAELPMFGIGIA